MTRKIFWDNPYLTGLQTHVTGIQGDIVTVAETIFYAFAGGQESDAGTIAGYPVLKAEKADLDIYYTLPDDHTLAIGDSVLIQIDWERRYRLMRLHFAAEIILELVYQHTESIEKIGAHIAQDKSRIDFEWSQNIATLFPVIQAKAEQLIRENHPITSAFSDPEQERRYWEIAGFGKVACGGTHLKTTAEVGQLSLKRKNIGKGKERIEISLVDALV